MKQKPPGHRGETEAWRDKDYLCTQGVKEPQLAPPGPGSTHSITLGCPQGHPSASIVLPHASQHVTSDPEVQRRHCESQLGKQMARRPGFPCAKGSDLVSWGSPAGRDTGPSHLTPGHPRGPRFSKTMRSFHLQTAPQLEPTQV